MALSSLRSLLCRYGLGIGVVLLQISVIVRCVGCVCVQARGIFEAALAAKAKGWVAVPNIMVPLVGCVKEFETQVMCC